MHSKRNKKDKIDVLMAFHSYPRKKNIERDFIVMILPLKIGNKLGRYHNPSSSHPIPKI